MSDNVTHTEISVNNLPPNIRAAMDKINNSGDNKNSGTTTPVNKEGVNTTNVSNNSNANINDGIVNNNTTGINQEVKTEIKDETTNVDNSSSTGENNQVIEPIEQLADIDYVLNSITTNLGLELNDKEKELFAPILGKNFGDDPNNIIELVKGVGRITGSRMIDEYWKSIPSDVKKYAEYRSKGGQPDAYFQVQSLSYDKIKFAKEDTIVQKDMIVEAYTKLNGMSEKEATELADYYLDKGNGYEKANELKSKLVQYQKQESDKLLAQQHEAYLQQTFEANKRKQVVEEKISKGILNVNGEQFIIPEADRKVLANAINTPYYDEAKRCYYDINLKPIAPNKVTKNVQLLSVADAAKMQYGADGELLSTYFFLFKGLDKLVKQKQNQEIVNRLKNINVGQSNINNKLNTQQTNTISNDKLDKNKIVNSKVVYK